MHDSKEIKSDAGYKSSVTFFYVSLNDPPVWLWEAPTWTYMEDDSSKWGRMCGSAYGFFFEGRCPKKGMYRDS